MNLNNEQEALVKADPGSEMLIKGVAGSGKTTVALHRALYLQQEFCIGADDVVLLITYGKALIKYLGYIYEIIEKEYGPKYANLYSAADKKVKKQTIDSLIYEQYQQICGEKALKQKYFEFGVRSIFKDCISEVKKDYSDIKLIDHKNSQFLIDEIDWIKSCNYTDLKEYQKVDRIGRARIDNDITPQKLAKNSKERQAIFDLMKHFDRRMGEKGYIYYKDIAIEVYNHAKDNPQKEYKHIIVDEGQDLSRVQLEFIETIYRKDKDSSLTFVADTAQSIYPHAWLVKGRSFSSIGFDMTGKSYTLTKNYRTSTQVAQAAYSMIENDNNIVGCDDYVQPSLVDQQGQYPVLRPYDTERSESIGVYESIKKLYEQGYVYSDIVVIAREKKRLEIMKEVLEEKNIPCKVCTSSSSSFGKKLIQLMTMHAIKGLEYKVVFIITLNEDVIPYVSDHMQESLVAKESSERKLFYVGMTRAREQLFMSYYKKPSKFIMDINSKYLRKSPDKRIKSFYKVAVDDYIYKDKIRNTYGREEEVRQWVARELIETYGYKKTMIEFERKVGFGSRSLSIDIVILANNKGRMAPYIIFETKAPGSDLEEGLKQLESYMNKVPTSKYGVITDGQNLLILNSNYEPVEDIPIFQQSMCSYGGDTFIFSDFKSNTEHTLKIDCDSDSYVTVVRGQNQEDYTGREILKVPVYERVAAGSSQIMDERVADYFCLPANWFKGSGDVFMLKVKGDSMINAGINDGDAIVAIKQNYAQNNDIVVVCIGDEGKVKRYSNAGSTVLLQSENSKYGPEHVLNDLVHIMGVVVGMIRGK